MKDYNTKLRQKWIEEEFKDIERGRPDDSLWWWAIAITGVALLFMLVAYIGPAVFPAGR